MNESSILRTSIAALLLLGLVNCQNRPSSLNNKALEVKSNNETISENKYTYVVSGLDEEGNKVHGAINLEGNNGLGILTQNDGKHTEIVIESIQATKTILATNEEGFKYRLKIISKVK
jgi:hypothetical protein